MFTAGQRVKAVSDYAYQVTEGKEYTVVEFIPKQVTPTFTWPEYVTVISDNGKEVTGHAHRFVGV
jgi:hypothetical protein